MYPKSGIIAIMNIVVKGKHLTENKALEDYALSKSEKFYHHRSDIVKIEIELRSEIGRKDKETNFIADITVKIPGHTLKITDQERDMYKAIDRAVRRMSETLRREKEKHSDRFRRHLKRFIEEKAGIPGAVHAVRKRLFRER